MKTTLVIDERIYSELKQEAVRRNQTISELVEAALRLFLRRPGAPRTVLPPLPTFKGGDYLLDVSNRDELDQLGDG